jgi:hypothetical protein
LLTRDRLGVVPLSTLSEWTDVLHLSSKWAFDHLRDAAIKAVVPLASPVDKLVLARTYGFLDWIPGAYADLLAREEDLDEDEAERMTIKDILAIAKGRRAAAKVGSRSQIEKIVHGLLPSEFVPVKQEQVSLLPASDIVITQTRVPLVLRQPPTADITDELLISRWLTQINTSKGTRSAQRCLITYC